MEDIAEVLLTICFSGLFALIAVPLALLIIIKNLMKWIYPT